MRLDPRPRPGPADPVRRPRILLPALPAIVCLGLLIAATATTLLAVVCACVGTWLVTLVVAVRFGEQKGPRALPDTSLSETGRPRPAPLRGRSRQDPSPGRRALAGVRAHLNRAGGTARPASRRLPQPTAPQPAAPDATRAGRHPRRAARVCRVPPRRAVPDHPSRPVTVHSSTALRSEGHRVGPGRSPPAACGAADGRADASGRHAPDRGGPRPPPPSAVRVFTPTPATERCAAHRPAAPRARANRPGAPLHLCHL